MAQGVGVGFISIHTPAKGVTSPFELTYFIMHFNPHSREGSDCNWIILHLSLLISIHTPAKGVTAILPNFRLYIL